MKEKEEGPIEPQANISSDFLVSPVVNTESLTTIDDVCSEKVAEGILKAAEGIYEITSTFAENVCNRSFNSDDLLLLNNMPTGLTVCHRKKSRMKKINVTRLLSNMFKPCQEI